MSANRLAAVVEREAHHWGSAVRESYHAAAAAQMGTQWRGLVGAFFDRHPFDLSRCIDFAAGFGRNTRKLLEVGAGHVTMVDVNPTCFAHLALNLPPDRTRAVLNSGVDLSSLPDEEFTFLYTYDAMVHFDPEVVAAYVPEFGRVLQRGAYALVHHANFTDNPGGDFRDNPHWRNFMSADIFKDLAIRSGFKVVEQQVFAWGEPDLDCISVLRRR